MNLRCPACGRGEPLQTDHWCCVCGQPFSLEGIPPFRRGAIDHRQTGLWRYRDMLPPLVGDPVSMGEGGTPLLVEEWDGLHLGFKLEFLAPTGSFKDRGTSVLVSFLRSWGISDVVDDSSGNAGASLAAYGARAGLRVRIFAPAHTSAAKRAQIEVYGAELVLVEGPRARATEAALQAVEAGAYYASHAYNPLFAEGVATLTYEALEQLDWRAPDNLAFPVGNGSLVVGAHLALKRLQAAGFIERLPRLFAVQAAGCAPLWHAWRDGMDEVEGRASGHTIAEGIAVTRPALGRAVLQAVRETGGEVLVVDDAEITTARRALAHRGIYVEPSAAAPVAALPQLRDRIRPSDLSVIALTGHGLKSE